MTTTTTTEPGRIGELVRYFLRLGCLGFGGPVALVGQMERELVDGKKWLTKEQMREAIAICQSLPGPLAMGCSCWQTTDNNQQEDQMKWIWDTTH
jgi:chromate transporter